RPPRRGAGAGAWAGCAGARPGRAARGPRGGPAPPPRRTGGGLPRRCRVTPGATTQRVQRLEGDGYVERVRDEHDRRTVYVALTPGGSAKLDEVFAAVMAGDEAVLASLAPRDRRSLERILGTWLSAAGLDATTPG